MRYDEAILIELRGVRALLEKMLQPVVQADPRVHSTYADGLPPTLPPRPFGDQGVSAPVGTIMMWPRDRLDKLPIDWHVCDGSPAPVHMRALLGNDYLPDTRKQDNDPKSDVHIIRVGP